MSIFDHRLSSRYLVESSGANIVMNHERHGSLHFYYACVGAALFHFFARQEIRFNALGKCHWIVDSPRGIR